ncbi:MAG: Crp/Fnr family transcriptional regulator [Vicinamibacterales bacterium]
MSAYLVHVGYGLMLAALVARDVLWLRILLVAAQTVLAVYAFSIGVPAIWRWNLLFVAINAYWTARILRERRAVTVPDALKPLHEDTFRAMSPSEFLRFWDLGTPVEARDAVLTTEGDYPDALWIVVSGRAAVRRGARTIAQLTDGQFAGEMSLVTGRPANATVVVQGGATLRSWGVSLLRDLESGEPGLWSRLQAVLGTDLVGKVRRGDPVDA